MVQGKDFLRDLHGKASRLHSLGNAIAGAQNFLAYLLPSLAAGLESVGLPSQGQLHQMITAGQQQELAAGAAAIVDAVAPIQQDERFEQVMMLPHRPDIKTFHKERFDEQW